MNNRKLSQLIAAGIFSASLLSGVAYAADGTMDQQPTQDQQQPAPAKKAKKKAMKGKHKKGMAKELAKHDRAGKNDCKGQGGCATDGSKQNKAVGMNLPSHSCAGKNDCKGQGGCASK